MNCATRMWPAIFIAATAIVMLAVPVIAAGLGGIEVSPYVGIYTPLRTLSENSTLRTDYTGSQTVRFEETHKDAVSYGVRISAQLLDRLMAEATFCYIPSDIETVVYEEGLTAVLAEGVLTFESEIWMATARLVYPITVPGSPLKLQLNAGPALVQLGGETYRPYSGTTLLGAVGGAGARFSLGSRTSIRVDAENYLYKPSLSHKSNGDGKVGASGSPESRWRSDLVISAGLGFGIGL